MATAESPSTTFSLRASAVAFACLVLVGSSCASASEGAGPSDSDAVVEAATPVPTTAPIATPVPTAEPVPTVDASSQTSDEVEPVMLMPDLLCMDLQEVQNRMQEELSEFFAVESYDASGEDRAQLFDRNWTVVEQSPLPGEPVGDDPSVGAVKDDEAKVCGAGEDGAAASEESAGDAEQTTAEPTVAESPALSVSAQNAIRSAENHLDIIGISRVDLIEKLVLDGFSTADATLAADTISVSWVEQAADRGEGYLEIATFSKSDLIEQLEFDGFTSAEATAAVDSLSASWRDEAAQRAARYLGFTSFSCSELIEQLVSDGFSKEDATYGAGLTDLCA